jgi:hypothetical protein
MDERQSERTAQNQSLFRQINDEVARLNAVFEQLSPYGSWVCECADTSCVQSIEMTLGEYEQLRADPARFAVYAADEHVAGEAELVVEKTDRYWIVQKVGRAGAVAVELAPPSTDGAGNDVPGS